jgi:hypothetical protein
VFPVINGLSDHDAQYLITNNVVNKKPRTWTDSLDKRPKQKMDTRFGIWNIRSMYRAGSLRVGGEEISKYKLDLVGVQEVRWDEGGTERAGEYIFLWKRE